MQKYIAPDVNTDAKRIIRHVNRAVKMLLENIQNRVAYGYWSGGEQHFAAGQLLSSPPVERRTTRLTWPNLAPYRRQARPEYLEAQ